MREHAPQDTLLRFAKFKGRDYGHRNGGGHGGLCVAVLPVFRRLALGFSFIFAGFIQLLPSCGCWYSCLPFWEIKTVCGRDAGTLTERNRKKRGRHESMRTRVLVFPPGHPLVRLPESQCYKAYNTATWLAPNCWIANSHICCT